MSARCVVCGRFDGSHCDECHRTHDRLWGEWDARHQNQAWLGARDKKGRFVAYEK